MLLSILCPAAIPIWIDTDPSVSRGGHEVDDGLALIEAFRSPELSIRGVSVVFGNAPLDTAFPIGRALVRDFGPQHLAIYRGALSAQQRGKETDASRALTDALSREGDLTILALGPVTNIATVLQNHPELSRHVTQIVAVAGRRPHQRFVASPNAHPFRDFNFEMDPDSFQILLDSGIPLVLVPWEISSKVWLHKSDLEEIRASNKSIGWVINAASDWLDFWKKSFGTDGFNPFDTLAVGYVRSSSSFSCQALPITIQTLPDDTVDPNQSNVLAKRYLIADSKVKSNHSALYCYQAPRQFAPELVRLLSKPNGFSMQRAALDHSKWDKLLKQYVTPESRVDYAGLKERAIPELDAYLHELAAPWPESMDRNATKAALIDAYNALTVRWILSNYPTPSIWSTDQPFQVARHTIDKRQVSLDEIEGQLRSMHDLRIHAALVCASRSCPPLRREAYLGSRIDEQLDDNVRGWLSNTDDNEYLEKPHVARVSKIFDWYSRDFGGTGGVRRFVASYAPENHRELLQNSQAVIEYKTYDWGLNDSLDLGKNYSQLRFYWGWARNGYLFGGVRTWFLGLGEKYGVNPLVFGAIYVGAIPFFSLSVAWLIRNTRRHKSIALPTFFASFCFVSAYLYLFIAGKYIPSWVYGFVVLMVVLGVYSTVRKIRSKLRESQTS
jgi:pyrimidine-specific ribonucleoside hydrolase